jgi:hypothetical protein
MYLRLLRDSPKSQHRGSMHVAQLTARSSGLDASAFPGSHTHAMRAASLSPSRYSME